VFSVLAVVSLLLCVATVAMWVRSYPSSGMARPEAADKVNSFVVAQKGRLKGIFLELKQFIDSQTHLALGHGKLVTEINVADPRVIRVECDE
jgi:hypothetical protein